jgi:hypothetical protein
MMRLARYGWEDRTVISTSRTSPFRSLEARVLGITTREQAFGAPEDKIDRRKGVLEGGRRGGNEGAGERVFEPRLQYGDENKV